MSRFESQETDPKLTDLTDYMGKALLTRSFSFADHQTFAPMLDELVIYTKMSL